MGVVLLEGGAGWVVMEDDDVGHHHLRRLR